MDDNKNKPHRVIYRFLGKLTTRVFHNLISAQNFSKNVETVQIQLASEKPDIIKKVNSFKKTINRNKCLCGKTKLTAEEHCGMCFGINSMSDTHSKSYSIFGNK